MNQLTENPILYIDYIIIFLTPEKKKKKKKKKKNTNKQTKRTNYDKRKNETTHYNFIYNENKNN